jgi:hypothetical protein
MIDYERTQPITGTEIKTIRDWTFETLSFKVSYHWIEEGNCLEIIVDSNLTPDQQEDFKYWASQEYHNRKITFNF